MRISVVVAILLGTLTACSASPTPVSPPAIADGGETSSTPTAAPTPVVTAVDASEYSTEMGGDTSRDEFDGVDFDSADGTIHCGIFDPFYAQEAPQVGCIADSVDFLWPEIDAFGEMTPANAVSLSADRPGFVTIVTDVSYAGQYPADYPNLRRLEDGTSITWSTITCVAQDGSIACENTEAGHGFVLSHTSYEIY